MSANPELDRWNRRFATEEYVFGTEPNSFLVRQRPLLRAGQKALAIADGEGRNGIWMAEQGLHVLSIDFSPPALEKARRLAEQRDVAMETRLADLESWNWEPGRFDVVAAIFIQFAPPDLRTAIFLGIKRTLAPEGLLLLQGYRPEQLKYGTGGPRARENLYTAAMLRAAFAEFEILHLQEYDAVISEGNGHHGMSALVDMVVRKPS